ncbi:hypothetical protein LOTGIDRAFT_175808 [Lottia gigantea]|uniref:Bromo domain-containing protein n=1 Tax=Lottia gigantea TaxID=225164 RepID=V4BP54_LOTGI|nr:hypothetical protein LOTGIDRAFT_175808 [Lottia gigantea]ESO90734.1 hypothetical protein LOTGIDRAFT_175808 [Lottia gigantea]
MPAKRKRSLAPGADGKVDEREESPAPVVKKRKKILHYDPVEICQELYDIIRNHKTEDSRLLCETFIRAPKRRTAADYYEVVTTPIDLLKIQQKLKTEEYDDIDQLTSDVELLVKNAKAYYKKDSQEYNDAEELYNLYDTSRNDLLAEAFGVGEAEDTKNEEAMDEEDDKLEDKEEEKADADDLEALFGVVVTAREDDRDLSLIFQLLPAASRYPDYYEVIKDPIDLRMIGQKIQNNEYKTLADLEKDLLLMLKNAKTFNTPKSQIYKDSMTLRKLIIAKRHELEHKQKVTSKSERLNLRTREKCPIQKMSAICAQLTYPSDDESDIGTVDMNTSQIDYDSEADTTVSDDENPQWALYNTIRNYQTVDGDLSLPFLKLPNKRIYRDYYEEIKRPISLFQIRKKLKQRQYSSLSELASDMNLMFENAKRYNMAQSRLYKDAVILQKAMMERKRELDKFDVKVGFHFINLTEGCYCGQRSRRPLTFHQIKGNLTRGRYKRLDRFQEDMFQVFDRARRLSRTDSQLYEDAVEMQMLFMKTRDELCKNGEMVLTPALSFMERHLQLQVEAEKKAKIPHEQKEDEEKKKTQEIEDKDDDKV